MTLVKPTLEQRNRRLTARLSGASRRLNRERDLVRRIMKQSIEDAHAIIDLKVIEARQQQKITALETFIARRGLMVMDYEQCDGHVHLVMQEMERA